MRKASPELAQFVEHLTTDQSKAFQVPQEPQIIEKAEFKRIPKEHIERWVTSKTGRKYPIVKDKYKSLHGRAEAYSSGRPKERRGRRGGGASAGPRVARAPSATEIRSAERQLYTMGGKQPIKIPGKRGRITTGVVGRTRGGRYRGKRRKLPEMQVHPVTGARYGPGVPRAPSDFRTQVEAAGARMAGGAMTSGVASTGQAISDVVGEKVRDWQILRSMGREERAKYLQTKAKQKRWRQRQEYELKAAGLWEGDEETTLGRVISSAWMGGLIGAARGAATFVNHLLARSPMMNPIEIGVNPRKAVQTLNYFRSRAKRNTFRVLAEAQMQQDKILAGMARRDPVYMTDNAQDALDYWKGVTKDIITYGNKKLGRGWAEDAAERRGRSIVKLTAMANEIYNETKREAIRIGEDDPDAVALRNVRATLGTDPRALGAIADVYTASKNAALPNMTMKINEIDDSKEEFEERVKAESRKIRNAVKQQEKKENIYPEGYKGYQGAVRLRGEERRSKERVGRRKAAWPKARREKISRAVQTEEARAKEPSKEHRAKMTAHFMNLEPNKFFSIIRSRRGRDYARSIYRGNPKKASEKLTRDFPINRAKAAQIIAAWKLQVEARSKATLKAELNKDLKKLYNVRNMVGMMQSEGVTFTKQITAVPVSDGILARQDLAGGKKRRRRRKHRRAI